MKNFRLSTLFYRVCFISSILCLCFLGGRNLHAQDGTAFQLQQFRQWGDSEGMFQTLSARTLQQWNLRFGAFFNYAKDPLVLRSVNASESIRSDNVMEHQVGMEVVAGLGLLNWLDVELALPVTLYQVGTIPRLSSVDSSLQGRNLDGGAIGDLRMALKFQGLTEKKHKFGLGAQIYLGLPTGTKERFNGEESVSFGLLLLAHKTFAERFRLVFNLGYRYLPETNFINLEISHELMYGLGLSVEAVKGRLVMLAEVAGAAGLVGNASTYTSPLEFLAGARIYPLARKSLAINLGVGAGVLQGYGTPQFRVILGLTWTRPPAPKAQPSAINLVIGKAPTRVPSPYPKLTTRNVPVVVPAPYYISIPIQFEFDKTSFTNRSRVNRTLDNIYAEIKGKTRKTLFCVGGHSGVKGAAARKQELSEQRAEKIREELIRRGIQAKQLVVFGYSDKVTLSLGTKENGVDRRVEIFSLPTAVTKCPAFKDRARYIKYLKDYKSRFQRGKTQGGIGYR